tara:strand:+ start:3376 stop:3597 length:222 start_codon:yes stop_codon:yes gene_type:complete
MLLSKEELGEIRSQAGSRTAQYQYMVPKLLGHIATLQAVVAVLEAEVQAAQAPAKKAPAKKAAAKKAPAKKKK